MLYTIVLIIHTLICIALVLVILSQTSKGGWTPISAEPR
jgi:protein translocase SecG subunit